MWHSSIEVQETKDWVTVRVHRQPYMQYRPGDGLAQRLAIVQLHALGVANQETLAAAFRVHINSVYNAVSTFRTTGSRGLCPRPLGPQGAWKVGPVRRGKILAVAFRQGTVNVEDIAQTLKEEWHEDISVFSIREVLRENGLQAAVPESRSPLHRPSLWEEAAHQLTLPLGDPSSSSERSSVAPAPLERAVSRSLASFSQTERLYLAQLREGNFNSVAGGLLFAPFLARARYLETMATGVAEGDADYTRDQLTLTLFYMNVFRVRSVEALKGMAPEELGLLMGKLTSPTLWTIRRFLGEVADHARTEEVVKTVTKTWLQLEMVSPTRSTWMATSFPTTGRRSLPKATGLNDKWG